MLVCPSFVTLIFALSAFGVSIKRDAAQVEKDIAKLDTQTKSLNETINDFSSGGGTLAEAMSIHMAATELESIIQNATTDITSSPMFTDLEANTMIASTNSLAGNVEGTLTNLISQKAALSAINANKIVESDLVTLLSDTMKLGAVYVAKFPDAQKSAVQKLMDTTYVALDDAKNTYAS